MLLGLLLVPSPFGVYSPSSHKMKRVSSIFEGLIMCKTGVVPILNTWEDSSVRLPGPGDFLFRRF